MAAPSGSATPQRARLSSSRSPTAVGEGALRDPEHPIFDLADSAGAPLKPGIFATGFEYSDCWVDDARLVVLNARDAAERGATIRTRARALAASRTQDAWHLTIADAGSGKREAIAARVLVNATGPWVGAVSASGLGLERPGRVRLVQGSHIVLPKLFDHDRAY